MKIVFATHNPNKLNEIKAMMPGSIKLQSLDNLGCHEPIPETMRDLEGNALQKARHVHEKYGVNCFADDTGLEVEALGGRPGVHSARYAGEDNNSLANMKKLLQEMHEKQNRKARFRTVIALIINGEEILFEGIVEGEIVHEQRGDKGFGYDPIFLPVGYTQTFAEMPLGEKNQISHRAKAFKMFADYLTSLNFL